tara:strand:- start:40 stop:1194 length:1155 start_codon:yes stop_codon:yes gene_type:complete
MNKNIIAVIFSTIFFLLIAYILSFFYIFFNFQNNIKYTFKSKETLYFHKKYSEKLHHLRDSDGRWEDSNNINKYLFSVINQFSYSKNILIQGDSWSEQFNDYQNSFSLLSNFVKKNNIGAINAGVTSYSPTLMLLQYEILEREFNIKPNMVVTYIDQTDIGDEICRYKNKRILNNSGKLIKVKKETFASSVYDYTKIYFLSKLELSDRSKFYKSILLLNFNIKYQVIRGIYRFKEVIRVGWENRDISKCRFKEIQKYLISSSPSNQNYFENKLKDYFNYLLKKDYIENIVVVTFPHKAHIFEVTNSKKERIVYSVNVSNIVDKIVKNEKKIIHLNFTNLINNKKIILKKNMYIKGDPTSHLNEKFHAEIFTKTIINQLKEITLK